MKRLLALAVLLLTFNANAATLPTAFFNVVLNPSGGGPWYDPYPGSSSYHSRDEVVATMFGSRHNAFSDQINLFAKGTVYIKANENMTVRVSRFSNLIDSDFFSVRAVTSTFFTYITDPLHIFVKKGDELRVSFSGQLEYWGQEIGVKATVSPAIEPVPLPTPALLLAPALLLLAFKPNRQQKRLQMS
jgi:hypothetical protein